MNRIKDFEELWTVVHPPFTFWLDAMTLLFLVWKRSSMHIFDHDTLNVSVWYHDSICDVGLSLSGCDWIVWHEKHPSIWALKLESLVEVFTGWISSTSFKETSSLLAHKSYWKKKFWLIPSCSDHTCLLFFFFLFLIYIYIYMCVCVCVCLCVCWYVYMYVFIYLFILKSNYVILGSLWMLLNHFFLLEPLWSFESLEAPKFFRWTSRWPLVS